MLKQCQSPYVHIEWSDNNAFNINYLKTDWRIE